MHWEVWIRLPRDTRDAPHTARIPATRPCLFLMDRGMAAPSIPRADQVLLPAIQSQTMKRLATTGVCGVLFPGSDPLPARQITGATGTCHLARHPQPVAAVFPVCRVISAHQVADIRSSHGMGLDGRILWSHPQVLYINGISTRARQGCLTPYTAWELGEKGRRSSLGHRTSIRLDHLKMIRIKLL